MGMSNELCSEKYNVTREDQDRYAAESYRRALSAIEAGKFKEEIVTISIPQRKGDPLIFDRDECPRESTYESLARLKPVFKKGGVTTPGNASIISDGAAAVVVMSREKAEAMGCQIMATIGAQASAGIDAKYLLVAPILGVPKCLAKEGIAQEEVDLFEINEAFSGSTVAVLMELQLDPDKASLISKRSTSS